MTGRIKTVVAFVANRAIQPFCIEIHVGPTAQRYIYILNDLTGFVLNGRPSPSFDFPEAMELHTQCKIANGTFDQLSISDQA